MNDNQTPGLPSAPPAPPQIPPTLPRAAVAAAGVPPWWMQPPKRRSWGRAVLRSFGVLVFILSVLMNVYLLLLLSARLQRGFETVTLREGQKDQTIAVYDLVGVIAEDAAANFSAFTREVLKNGDVKAVVLRVSSPGGGVGASDEIHHRIGQMKSAGKKVVVSMGSVAASGGYYVSVAADEIVAEPTTTTGSIGVIMAWPVIKGTLEKIGAEMVVLKSSHAEMWKDEASLFQAPDKTHRAHLQRILDQVQSRFEQVVKDGRGERLAPRQVPPPAQAAEGQAAAEAAPAVETEPFNGKIYLAEEAKALGMIDEIGYQDRAISRAAELAHLNSPEVVRYSVRHGLLASLLSSRSGVGLQLDARTLEEIQTPRIEMIWKAE